MISLRNAHAGGAIAFVLVAGMGLTSCTSQAEDQNSEVAFDDWAGTTITLADSSAEGTVPVRAIQAMVEAVEDRTEGKVKFETFYGSSLMPGGEMLEGMTSGTIDMGRLLMSNWATEVPISNYVVKLGSSIEPSTYPGGLLTGAIGSRQIYTENPEVLAELSSRKVLPLFGTSNGQQNDLLCNTPVTSLEDLAGLRVRAPGEPWATELIELGATPVNIAIGEVYEGLQRGVIDCVVSSVFVFMDFNFWEVAKYYVPIPLSQNIGETFSINSDVWETMPTEVQEIILEESHNAWVQLLQNTVEAGHRWATEGVEAHGVEFMDTSKIDPIAVDIREKNLQNFVPGAPAGLDASAMETGFYAMQGDWAGRIMTMNEPTTTDKRAAYIDAMKFDFGSFSTEVESYFSQ